MLSDNFLVYLHTHNLILKQKNFMMYVSLSQIHTRHKNNHDQVYKPKLKQLQLTATVWNYIKRLTYK